MHSSGDIPGHSRIRRKQRLAIVDRGCPRDNLPPYPHMMPPAYTYPSLTLRLNHILVLLAEGSDCLSVLSQVDVDSGLDVQVIGKRSGNESACRRCGGLSKMKQ
jgi:hypothetical protein